MPEIRAISGHEVRQSLSVLLREPDDDFQTAQKRAASFENMASANALDLNRQVVVSHDSEIIFSCFIMPHQGNSAFFFISNPDNLSADNYALALEAVGKLVNAVKKDGYKFLQLMVSPEEAAKVKLAVKAGFKEFSRIHYMYRSVNSRIGVVRIPPGTSWQIYSEKNHHLFAETIEKTWIDSLDCPELPEVRSVEETIEGYKAAGRFTPSCWSLMVYDSEPIGVSLLSPLHAAGSIELTYAGVIPDFRHRGFGKIMLNRAISLSAIEGYKIITLAVDENNTYASKMYCDAGFKDMFSKIAMLYFF